MSRSMQQLGGSFGELLIPPPTKSEPYPPLPLEIDDEYIFEQSVQPQPLGTISKLKAFNLNCKIFQTVTPLATMELAYGIDSVFDINKQKQVMEGCLRAVKTVLNDIPRELMLQPGSQAGEFAASATPYYPPMPAYPGMQTNGNDTIQRIQESLEKRRMLQFEIQKANIYASQLGTRSYIVEKYWTLETAHDEMKMTSGGGSNLSSPDVITVGLDGMLSKQAPSKADEINIANERESVVKDLLQMLGSISQVNMEPNGASFVRLVSAYPLLFYINSYLPLPTPFMTSPYPPSTSSYQSLTNSIPIFASPQSSCLKSNPLVLQSLTFSLQINKIRQIASTLLETPENRKGPMAMQGQAYLEKFLDVLMKLERINPGPLTDSRDPAEAEEEELRNWADLRENQMQFLKAGGFLSEI
jgi:hypothetical protein